MAINPLIKYKHAVLYGVALAGLLCLLKWLEWRLVIFDHAFEVYIGAIAVVFTALGIWLALKLTKPKVERVIVEKTVYVERREAGRPEVEGGGGEFGTAGECGAGGETGFEQTGAGSAGIDGAGIQQPGDRRKAVCLFEYDQNAYFPHL